MQDIIGDEFIRLENEPIPKQCTDIFNLALHLTRSIMCSNLKTMINIGCDEKIIQAVDAYLAEHSIVVPESAELKHVIDGAVLSINGEPFLSVGELNDYKVCLIL